MAECKGLVKLFGKTIQVPPDENWCRDQAKENSNHSLLSAATPRDDEAPRSEDTNDQATASSTASNDQRPSSPAPLAEQEPIMAVKPFSFQANDSANTDSLQNPPKKPDKILPCPRCNSQDTKFCYYNNYNLNQPRHFCKNCQRYWTDGGTMRNVPIGAGRRRGKNSASVQLKQMTIPGNAPQIVVQRQQCTNGTMLSFTSEMVNASVGPMASVPNVTENMTRFGKKEEQRNSHSNSCGAAVIGTVQKHKDASVQVPLNFSSSWSSNWNPAFPMYSPNYYPPVFYPVGQCWSFAPCISPGLPPLTSVTSNAESWQAEPCSPLGKHSRDELHPVDKNVDSASANAEYNNQEKSIWVPKTLRISDPEEAAMSSIWLSIGIKKGKGEDAASGGMFKGFEAKTKFDAKNSALETSQHINPNPAALSRSHDFHERLS